MVEVELLDDDSEPREFSEKLLAVRLITLGSKYISLYSIKNTIFT